MKRRTRKRAFPPPPRGTSYRAGGGGPVADSALAGEPRAGRFHTDPRRVRPEDFQTPNAGFRLEGTLALAGTCTMSVPTSTRAFTGLYNFRSPRSGSPLRSMSSPAARRHSLRVLPGERIPPYGMSLVSSGRSTRWPIPYPWLPISSRAKCRRQGSGRTTAARSAKAATTVPR